MSQTRIGIRLLLAAAAAWGLSMGRASAQITKVGADYQFRVKYVAGKKRTYAMKTNTKPLGGNVSIALLDTPGALTGPIIVNVQSIMGGNATLKVTLGPLALNGKPAAKEQSETIQVDEHNKLADTGAGAIRIDIGDAVLPPNPISIGDHYTMAQKLSRNGRTMDLITMYTFKGVKTVGGQEVAEMQASITGQGSLSYNSVGTILLSVADGTMVSSTMTQTIKLTKGKLFFMFEAETVIKSK